MATPFDIDNCVKQNIILKATNTDYNQKTDDYINDNDNVSFITEINEPLINVLSIKHVKTYIELVGDPLNLDMINIKINEYDLIHSYNFQKITHTHKVKVPNPSFPYDRCQDIDDTSSITKKTSNETNRCFISLPITDSKFLSLKNDSFAHIYGDPQSYSANPAINNLKQFKVELFKSDGTYYKYSEIKTIFIELCILSTYKKLTQA